MAEIVVPSVLHEGREYRRCLHCHRSAIVIRRLDREEEQ
jgi:ribosomal protein S14